MISCSASGVGKVVCINKDLEDNEYVLLEIERPFFDQSVKKNNDFIPLYDWHKNCRRLSSFIDEKDIIAFKGRIETRAQIGIIIVCEQISVILKSKK